MTKSARAAIVEKMIKKKNINFINQAYFFRVSFVQVSFNVIVRLKISGEFLSGANEAHMTFFSQDQRQAKPGILRAQLPRHAAERAPRRSDEVVFLVMAVSIFHDIPSIALSWAGGQVSD
jgi:hypothetical protein